MNKTLKNISVTLWLMGLLSTGYILPASAADTKKGGTSLGATRLIYPQGATEISVPVTNSSSTSRYLIQSWMENAAGQKTTDFVVTPPLFVSKPKAESTLRIMYIGGALPADRETVFYLHSKTIPSVNPNTIQSQNVLQIAIESVIKVFVRPKGLPVPADKAPSQLKCTRSGGQLKITNPSPYYVSLVEVNVGLQKLDNTMVPPKGNISLRVPQNAAGSVTFKAVNDYGSYTPKLTCSAG